MRPMRWRPRGRSVDCTPSCPAVHWIHRSSPYGRLRLTHDCNFSCSAEVWARFTQASQSSGGFADRLARLLQGQRCANLTKFARGGLRSTPGTLRQKKSKTPKNVLDLPTLYVRVVFASMGRDAALLSTGPSARRRSEGVIPCATQPIPLSPGLIGDAGTPSKPNSRAAG